MGSYKVLQHRISHAGKSFHFVSYDGVPANVRRGEPATGPMWYLMRAGKRWPVMPQVAGQAESETASALGSWLKSEGLVSAK
ncbi:MAG: hypothetical protein ABI681_09015 [Gemmatimonadales bacterium]